MAPTTRMAPNIKIAVLFMLSTPRSPGHARAPNPFEFDVRLSTHDTLPCRSNRVLWRCLFRVNEAELGQEVVTPIPKEGEETRNWIQRQIERLLVAQGHWSRPLLKIGAVAHRLPASASGPSSARGSCRIRQTTGVAMLWCVDSPLGLVRCGRFREGSGGNTARRCLKHTKKLARQ